MKLTRICFKVSSWGQENDSFGISYHAFGKELKINHDKTKCNRNKTRMRYTRREAACVRFLLRTKEVNTGTAVYSIKYVLGRYLKELFEIPAFDYWQKYSGVQTAEQCKRDLQLFSLPLKRMQNRLSG